MSRIITDVIQSEGQEVQIHIEVGDEERAEFERTMNYGPTRGGRDALSLVSQPFEKGMELIRTCAEQVVSTINRVAQATRPDEVEVEIGIKFDGEVGALISRTGAEAHLQVTLKWIQRATT